jgi:hypothetical protein
MPKKQKSAAPGDLAKLLRTAALALPNVEEGIACAGTSLEKRTLKIRGKAFLFLAQSDAMLKLSDSLPTATKLATAHPDQLKVGAHGWTTLRFAITSLPLSTLQSWIVESYQLFAPAGPGKATSHPTKERTSKAAAPQKPKRKQRSSRRLMTGSEREG